MAATFGFPFTAAQWKELETQAMIYKYMVASVPVPYQLLLPIIQNIPNTPPTASATHSHHPLVRYSTKQDLEPGRCKRTDGKKWRCSRDVAPNQKYCERHMHRGRPRSRKHVEPSKNPTNPSTISNPLLAKNNNNPSPKVVGSTILPSATQPPFFLHNMQRDWSTEGGCEQQWRQIMQISRSIFNNTNDFGVEPALSFTDFATSHDDYLGSRRDFEEDKSKDSAGNLALDLSMAMANSNGFGEVSCGGPLAEVLPPSLSLVARYPTGDGDGDGRMTMLSDGSVCKSPTVAPSSTPTADIVAFQWFT